MLKEILGQEKAWCVEENSLSAIRSADTRNTLPRGLSLGRDDAEFLSDQAIHECGFARVGTAKERHITGAGRCVRGWNGRIGRLGSHGRKITLPGSSGKSRRDGTAATP